MVVFGDETYCAASAGCPSAVSSSGKGRRKAEKPYPGVSKLAEYMQIPRSHPRSTKVRVGSKYITLHKLGGLF